MNKYAFLPLIVLLFVLVSCDSEQQPLLPQVTGKPGEVIVVIDEYQWNSDIGNFFRNLFSQPVPALPQEEPIYNPIRIASSNFNNIFKSHRNIILTKISSRHQKPRIIVQRDIWAKPQLVINVIGPKDTTTLNYLMENADKLVALLDQAELDRTILNYKRNRAKGIDESLHTKHNLSISVPAGYVIKQDTNNFVWISHDLSDLIQGVLIYYYDYTDSNTFTSEYLIRKRNQFLKKYVPGPNKGSYMSTEELVPVLFGEYTKNDLYVAEMRGLWKLENGFMGGPFISMTSLDQNRNRVVTVEGFVFAPGLDKRNYIRQLEAILHTFKILE